MRVDLVAPGLALALVLAALGMQERPPEAGRSPVLSPKLPADQGILDPSLQAPPASAAEVLVERLVFLGASPADALALFDRAAVSDADISSPEALAAWLGVPSPLESKAARLIEAWLAGRPVSLEGIDVPATWPARIEELVAMGLDPEQAAWLVRQEHAASLRDSGGQHHLHVALEHLALPDEQRVRLHDHLLLAEPEALLPILNSSDDGDATDDRLMRRLRGPEGEFDFELPGDEPLPDGMAPSPCPACPAYHYGNFIPTANWLVHQATVPAASCRVYRFALTAGRTYRFTTCEGGGSSTFTTTFETASYQNQQCADGPGSSPCIGGATLDYTPAYSGFFFLKVRNHDAVAGTLRLAYRDITPRCLACPSYDFGIFTPTINYQTHSQSFGAGECRTYRFNVQAGRSYRFTTCGTDSSGVASGASATFDTILEAFGPTCAALGSNDDACGTASELDVTPVTSGALYIRIMGSAGGSGSYTLAYRDRTPCATCPSQDFGPFTPTTAYQVHSSAITAERCKLYRFNVTAGKTYRFTTCATDPEGRPAGGAASFDSVLEVYNSGCAFVTSNDDQCGSQSLVDVTPSYTGALYVRVRGFNPGDSGSYSLAYRDLAGPCKTCPAYDVAPVNPTTVYQSAPPSLIEPNGGCRTYRFYLLTGNTYRFGFCNPDSSGVASPGSVSFDSVLELRNATCTLMTSNDDACGTASELDFTPTTTGYYFVRVRGKSSADEGPFTLAYRQLLGVCKTCPAFDYGSFTPTGTWWTHPATMLPEACRVYRFYLTAGRTYEFSLCHGGGSSDFPAVITGYSPGCAPIGGSFGRCPSATHDYSITAAVTGFHYIKVEGVSATDSGNYRLAYRDFRAACQASCATGTFNHGTFTPTNAFQFHSDFIEYYCQKTYRFSVTAGTVVHVWTCAPGSATFDAELIGQQFPGCAPAGPISNDACGSQARLDWLATYSGFLYVTIRDQTGAPGGGGNYTIAYRATPNETVANFNCNDDVDNDLDGLIDCHPPGDPGCNCGTESIGNGNCSDGVDNDNDGLMDGADPNCVPEGFLAGTCADGIDNDLDGLIDCQGAGDTGCPCGPESAADFNCADGVDNDGDGLTDGADPGC